GLKPSFWLVRLLLDQNRVRAGLLRPALAVVGDILAQGAGALRDAPHFVVRFLPPFFCPELRERLLQILVAEPKLEHAGDGPRGAGVEEAPEGEEEGHHQTGRRGAPEDIGGERRFVEITLDER